MTHHLTHHLTHPLATTCPNSCAHTSLSIQRGVVRADGANGATLQPVQVWQALHDSIVTACTLRGDTAANVAGLLREAADCTLEAQRDLLAHFREQAAIWRAATGEAS